MPTTEAERKAVAKYHAKLEDIKIRVPKGEREKYKQHAESKGISLNQLIINLLEADIKTGNQSEEKQQPEEPTDGNEEQGE